MKTDYTQVLKQTLFSLNGLVVYHDILQEGEIRQFCELLALATAKEADPERICRAYFAFFRQMLGKNWPDVLLQSLLDSSNPFTRQAAAQDFAELDPLLRESAARDLRIVQKLAEITPQIVKTVINRRFGESWPEGEAPADEEWNAPPAWPEWDAGWAKPSSGADRGQAGGNEAGGNEAGENVTGEYGAHECDNGGYEAGECDTCEYRAQECENGECGVCECETGEYETVGKEAGGKEASGNEAGHTGRGWMAQEEAYAVLWLREARRQVIKYFEQERDWQNNVRVLADFHRKAGQGLFAKYPAFVLRDDAPVLVGVANPDPIRISRLIRQENEQAIVLQNTQSFLQGYPANNIILYGSRGTGKSSLVKALLNEYVQQGLRLIQLKKSQIKFFPQLLKELSAKELLSGPLRFLIFIDDLSFLEEENDYRDIKSLLEGGVEVRPQNIVIYATSNRRHFVKESFSERRVDDIHALDNMDEKLSLADRFGITVTFLSPDQETYLAIVQGLARQYGLEIDSELLRQKALQWALLHNGRSGRTARQFIDALRAEIAAAN